MFTQETAQLFDYSEDYPLNCTESGDTDFSKKGDLYLFRAHPGHQPIAGIHLTTDHSGRQRMLTMLAGLGLLPYISSRQTTGQCSIFSLNENVAHQFMPNANTLDLATTMPGELQSALDNVEYEIMLTMLGAPKPIEFPSFDEFISSVRTRARIVNSAKRTQLAFGTSTAERPAQYWVYDDDVGYTVIPGRSLITALEKATQPEDTLYAFSCYRATEYVILHAIAQELADVNPDLLAQLQHLWEVRPIKSGEYHEVFLDEYGSIDNPLPIKFYIPGDRVWFRNPDPHSCEASGYEGSWVIYLGGGLFSNFWKRNQPYTFADKCIEIYHWRHATYLDTEGELRIDENVVEACVEKTRSRPDLAQEIIHRMAKPRDPKDVFAGGGCADVSREIPKPMCERTARIIVPN